MDLLPSTLVETDGCVTAMSLHSGPPRAGLLGVDSLGCDELSSALLHWISFFNSWSSMLNSPSAEWFVERLLITLEPFGRLAVLSGVFL